MVGTLTSAVSLAVCLTMGDAFILRGPNPTPPADSAWKRQAPASLGAPTGVDSERLGAGGTLSRISGKDAAEAKKKNLPWVPSAEGYASLGSQSPFDLHVFKGVQPEIMQGGNATVPIIGGVDGMEGEGWGAQNEEVAQHGRDMVMPEELSSLTDSFGTLWRSTAAAAQELVPRGMGSTHAAVITLEDKVDDAMNKMLHDALSGRPASKTVEQDHAVNDAIGSMLYSAFSGRAASTAVSSLHAGGGGSAGAGAGGLREPPISEVGVKTDDDDDSRLVAYNDYVRALAEHRADFERARARNAHNEAAVGRKAGKGKRQWLKKIWGRVRRKGR